jgi:hypothetical protein
MRRNQGNSRETKGAFKFRVTFWVISSGSKQIKQSGFSFHDLAEAKRCYRDTLLGLYKAKRVTSFSISLNRYRSKQWGNPIYMEVVDN